jgi:hypothetical protein
MPNEYPRWKHHAALSARLVDNPDEEAALGPDWSDRPQQPMHPGHETRPCPQCARVEAYTFQLKNDFHSAWGEAQKDLLALGQKVEALRAENQALRAENEALKAEPARVKSPKAR